MIKKKKENKKKIFERIVLFKSLKKKPKIIKIIKKFKGVNKYQINLEIKYMFFYIITLERWWNKYFLMNFIDQIIILLIVDLINFL